MAMDKINGSPLIRPGGLEQFLGTARSEKDGKAGAAGGDRSGASSEAKPADTMEISEAAHRLVDLRQAVDTGRNALQALPDVREDKVAEVRERLHQGYYNSQEVRDKVAEKLGSVFSSLDAL